MKYLYWQDMAEIAAVGFGFGLGSLYCWYQPAYFGIAVDFVFAARLGNLKARQDQEMMIESLD